MAKSLLNNLLGRLGINMDKAITDIMTPKTFIQKSLINKIIYCIPKHYNNLLFFSELLTTDYILKRS